MGKYNNENNIHLYKLNINNFIIVQVHNAACTILGCMPWRTTSCIPTKLHLVPISPYLSIMSDCFICHTSVIVGTMYAFCIDEYVLSLKHCIDACLKNVRILDMLHPANITAPAIIKLPNGIVPENGWLLHLNG
jgi:hypothetical protein